jgi:hypothetical protein
MNRNIAAYGIYPHQGAVNEAVDALRAAGFRNTDISVLFPENSGSKDFAHEKHSKAPEGAALGGGTGAAAGAALGWMAGAGALMAPGFEPLAAAGPVMGMLSGMGVGSVLGGMAGGLLGMGRPEYEAKRYEGRIRNGGILLSVRLRARREADAENARDPVDYRCLNIRTRRRVRIASPGSRKR